MHKGRVDVLAHVARLIVTSLYSPHSTVNGLASVES